DLLSLAPAPPASFRAAAVHEIAGTQGTALAHLREHGLDGARMLRRETLESSPHAFASLRLLHSPAKQRLTLDRQQRGLMPPVLDQPAMPRILRGALEEPARILAAAGERGQIVRAHEHVDGIDLHGAEHEYEHRA